MKRTLLLLLLALSLTGCACSTSPGGRSPDPSPSLRAAASAAPAPTAAASPQPAADYALPEQLTIGDNGVPLVEVYLAEEEVVETMDFESYLAGVLAGEMHNDWPLEALKAQAIIARTFALRFIEDGGSQYAGAQLSTDIDEAQAYDMSQVNDRIRQAVEETRGLVILCQGEPIQAWFHAHAGGVTALAQEGLGYDEAEPPYTRSVQVRESPSAPEDVRAWTATFPLARVQSALDALGGGDAAALAIGERGPSGRVTTLTAGETTVRAVDFRREIGSTEMKSTLLTDLSVGEEGVTISGSGYGHGVGMSQWGAYEMASDGKTAQEIIEAFYQNIEIARVYGE